MNINVPIVNATDVSLGLVKKFMEYKHQILSPLLILIQTPGL